MRVDEFIEWLKTMPQDATVQMLYHTSGSTYYDQGGNISVEDFKSESASPENNYSQHWELYKYKEGNRTLLIGTFGN